MRAALVKDHQLLSINPCRGPSRSVNAKIIYFLRLLKDYFWLALPVLLRCDRLEGERRESVTPPVSPRTLTVVRTFWWIFLYHLQ